MNMGRRRATRRESDASRQEEGEEEDEEGSSDEEEDGSSENGSASGDGGSDSDSDVSGDKERGEDEEEEEEEHGAKQVSVARDVEQMRAMCAEMDKMKRRLQFRLDAAREAKLDAARREAEAREQANRRQVAAADVDVPQMPVPTPNGPQSEVISPPAPVPVLKTDAGVQTDCDMVAMDRMETSLQSSTSSAKTAAPAVPGSLPPSNSVGLESAVSEAARVLPSSVDDRSPGLSINDFDKSGGYADGRPRNAASAFYDRVLTGFSLSKKMNTIPSVSSDSDRSATPDQPPWASQSHRTRDNRVVGNETLRTATSSFGNRPSTAGSASRFSHPAEALRESDESAGEQSARSAGIMSDTQDSLSATLSPVLTASADKTDEQREFEAIQSLLFGR